MKNSIVNLMPDTTVVSSIATAYFADRYLPIFEYIPYPITVIGWFVLATGIIGAFYIVSIIRANAPTSNVTEVPTHLIDQGFWGISRNPLYLSFIIITLGSAWIFGSIGALSGPLICIAVLHFFVVPIEESKLRAALGKRYEQYTKRVRRWI